MAECHCLGVRSRLDAQVGEQNAADDRDADGASHSLGRAEDGAGGTGFCLGYPGEHEVLVRCDHHPAAEPGEQQRADEIPVARERSGEADDQCSEREGTATMVQPATSTIRPILADNLLLIVADQAAQGERHDDQPGRQRASDQPVNAG